MSYISKLISNDPVFPDVERTVNVFGVFFNDKAKSIDLYYDITYMKNGADVSEDISKAVKPWVVSDTELMTVRDSQNNPIPNPEYDPEDVASNEFLKQPGHAYVIYLIEVEKVDLFSFLEYHIVNEDAFFGRFDR